MERLTKRYTRGISNNDRQGFICSNYCDHCRKADCNTVKRMIRKLAEYEDAEEQGLLIRLPCKVGDMVYRICPKCSDIHDGSCEGCAWYSALSKYGCDVYGYDGGKDSKLQIVPYKVTWEYIPNLIEHIGETVFLTREDAKKKLKKIT